MIGHSIGAHIAGFAGKVFSKSTSNVIQRITGLDPAGPCYFNEPSNLRLSKTDATFVDVIHTDIRALGITNPIGEYSIYFTQKILNFSSKKFYMKKKNFRTCRLLSEQWR